MENKFIFTKMRTNLTKQLKKEIITEEEYNKRIATLHSVDLTNVREMDDVVDFSQVAACAGGACEINI